MNQEYNISIITVNYNGYEDTCSLIDSVVSNHIEAEIIVVDNGSLKDEASKIQTRYPFVKAIRSNENLGFAGGNNLGIKAATGKYLFFLNNDTEFRGDATEINNGISSLIRTLESSKTIGMVCPKIRFSWDDSPIQFAGYTPLSPITLRNASIGYGEAERGQYNTAHPTPYAHGAAMMAKREAVDSAGLMPECYFLYYEELDWSMMFKNAGYVIWYDPSLTIYHKESRSTGQNSPLKTYYLTRNRLLFIQRNIPRRLHIISYLYMTLMVAPRDILKNIIKGDFAQLKSIRRGIYDFYTNRQGYRKL